MSDRSSKYVNRDPYIFLNHDSRFTIDELRLISNQLRQCGRPHDLCSVNMQSLDRVAEAFFGFIGLQIDDLFDICRSDRMASDDLVFRRRRVRNIVRFENAKARSLADLTVYKCRIAAERSRFNKPFVL